MRALGARLPSIGALLACAVLTACGGNGAAVTAANAIGAGSESTLPASDVSAGASAQRETLAVVTASTGGSTYTAPWGGFSNGAIFVRPANGCGYIPATAASGFNWPSFLSGLAAGSTITITGTLSYADGNARAIGCPTGGIVASAVALGASAAGGGTGGGGTSAGGGTGTGGSSGSGSVVYGAEAPNFDPPASWRPYSANSTWNQRLPNPNAPRLDPSDATKIRAMYSAGFGSNQYQTRVAIPAATAIAQGRGGGGFPFYFARTSDPQVHLNCTAGYGTCPFNGRTIYVPAKAMYAQDADHHIAIVQPNGTEVDVWQFGQNLRSGGAQSPPWYGGQTINVGWGGIANVASGTGWDLGDNGANAGGSDGLAGIVRVPELQAGVINHALAANVFCNPTSTPVYPATHSSYAGNCNGVYLSSNQIVGEGSRLWLDLTDSQINALNITGAQKTILHALHDYGAFVVDSNGYSPLGFGGIESQIPGAQYGNDLVGAYARQNLPLWYDWQGLTWYDTMSASNMTNIIQPHIHVLAPCVNTGYPGGTC